MQQSRLPFFASSLLRVGIISGLCGLFGGPLWAYDSTVFDSMRLVYTQPELYPRVEAGDLFVEMMRLSGYLFIVIGVIYLVTYLVKRFWPDAMGGVASNDQIVLLSSKMLDPRNRVCVVKVLDRVLVLGASEAGVQLLTEITDPLKVEDAIEQAVPNSAASGDLFDVTLKRFWRG